MSWWQALVLGIVEGVTEYLPISSTGHLILVSWALGLTETVDQEKAVNAYNIVIQAGAIIAVLGLYRQRVWQMVRGVCGRDPQGWQLARNLILAFLPAAVLGPLLADVIKLHLFRPWPVIAALFVGAWLMIVVDYRRRRAGTQKEGADLDGITWRVALLIGFAQCMAMWPGTSRSMVTIVAALLVGLSPRAAAEFSFLLGLITLSAATGYEVVFDGAQMIEHIDLIAVAIGFVAAALSAAVAIKWFVSALVRYGLAPFGWYRLGLTIAVAALILTGVMAMP